MKIRHILKEKLSSTVFHAGALQNLRSILAKNVLIASPLFTRDIESSSSNKSYFFISTARSRTSPFISSLLSQNKPAFVLQLDGDKLNQKYKGKSVNYFFNRKNSEMEDRLFTDEQYIRNVSEFIEQISVFIPPNTQPTDTMLEIERMAKKKSIPILFFTDKKDLISNNRRKAIDLGKTIKDIENPKPNIPKVTKNLEALIFFYENNNPNHVPPEYESYIKDLTLDNYKNSWISDIKKELNNFYRDTEVIGFFKDIMKKEKVYSIDELVNKVSAKWKKLSNVR